MDSNEIIAIIGAVGYAGGQLTQPLTKLVETVSAGAAVLYEPTGIRRKARAKADAAEIKDASDARLSQRAVRRQKAKIRRQQRNFEAATQDAVQFLPEAVSEQPVDQDWFNKWSNGVQDVSNEKMRIIWSKMLAGEVGKPGRFSQRTLSVVASISQTDADLFTAYCAFAWEFSARSVFFVPDVAAINFGSQFANFANAGKPDYVAQRVSQFGRLQLEWLGLIKMCTPGLQQRLLVEPQSQVTYYYHGQKHNVSTLEKPQELSFSFDILTSVGNELFGICGAEPHEEFRKQFVEGLRRNGFVVEE